MASWRIEIRPEICEENCYNEIDYYPVRDEDWDNPQAREMISWNVYLISPQTPQYHLKDFFDTREEAVEWVRELKNGTAEKLLAEGAVNITEKDILDRIWTDLDERRGPLEWEFNYEAGREKIRINPGYDREFRENEKYVFNEPWRPPENPARESALPSDGCVIPVEQRAFQNEPKGPVWWGSTRLIYEPGYSAEQIRAREELIDFNNKMMNWNVSCYPDSEKPKVAAELIGYATLHLNELLEKQREEYRLARAQPEPEREEPEQEAPHWQGQRDACERAQAAPERQWEEEPQISSVLQMAREQAARRHLRDTFNLAADGIPDPDYPQNRDCDGLDLLERAQPEPEREEPEEPQINPVLQMAREQAARRHLQDTFNLAAEDTRDPDHPLNRDRDGLDL